MDLELTQDKIDLIGKIIRADKKFSNNEDLFDDFFNETYKRAFLIIKTVKNETALESYLKKIVTTSIVVVLKNSGRLRRTTEGFTPVVEKPIEEVISQAIPQNPYSDVKISYDIVDLSDTPEEIVIKKETLQAVSDAVMVVHHAAPEKQFHELYTLRYVKGLKQKEIAKELNLSQPEVSKRLLELMAEVRKNINV